MCVASPDDRPVFLVEAPEHCFGCFRLIKTGQTYYLTIEQEVLYEDCAVSGGVIRGRDDLAVEVSATGYWCGAAARRWRSTHMRCGIW